MCGPHERRLINDLMRSYKNLERPVANESEAVVLKFGLTLQQIMDVVSSVQSSHWHSAVIKHYESNLVFSGSFEVVKGCHKIGDIILLH